MQDPPECTWDTQLIIFAPFWSAKHILVASLGEGTFFYLTLGQEGGTADLFHISLYSYFSNLRMSLWNLPMGRNLEIGFLKS